MSVANDPLITAPKSDRTEWQRQYQYLRTHPECESIPAKGTTRYRGGRAGARGPKGPQKKKKSNEPLEGLTGYWCQSIFKEPRVPKVLGLENITVTYQENPILYQKQYQYLARHPDADYMPQWVVDGKDDPNWRHHGCRHKDPRVTVRRCDDFVEYRRQTSYIRLYPDCKEVPPRNRRYSQNK